MPKIIPMAFKQDFKGLKITHKLPVSNIDRIATSEKRYFDDNLFDSYCFSQNMFRWNELWGKPISHLLQFHKFNTKRLIFFGESQKYERGGILRPPPHQIGLRVVRKFWKKCPKAQRPLLLNHIFIYTYYYLLLLPYTYFTWCHISYTQKLHVVSVWYTLGWFVGVKGNIEN